MRDYNKSFTIDELMENCKRYEKPENLIFIARAIFVENYDTVYLKGLKEIFNDIGSMELDILFDRYCEFKTYEELAIEYEMTPQKVKTIISVILRKFRSPKYMNKIRAVSREVYRKLLKEVTEWNEI